MRQNIEELEATQEAMQRVHANSQRNEAILNAMMEGTEEAVLALDTDYSIVAINEPMKRKFNAAKGALTKGANFLALLNEEKDLWQDRYAKAFRGQKLSFVLESSAAEGTAFSYHLNPVRDDKGVIRFVLLMMRSKAREAVS